MLAETFTITGCCVASASRSMSASPSLPGPDPPKNHQNLGVGADPIPPGTPDLGYGAAAIWNVDDLIQNHGLQLGHTYRLQVMLHDGDQDQPGGDCIAPASPPFPVPAYTLSALRRLPIPPMNSSPPASCSPSTAPCAPCSRRHQRRTKGPFRSPSCPRVSSSTANRRSRSRNRRCTLAVRVWRYRSQKRIRLCVRLIPTAHQRRPACHRKETTSRRAGRSR
jgi:hypothetical protein